MINFDFYRTIVGCISCFAITNHKPQNAHKTGSILCSENCGFYSFYLRSRLFFSSSFARLLHRQVLHLEEKYYHQELLLPIHLCTCIKDFTFSNTIFSVLLFPMRQKKELFSGFDTFFFFFLVSITFKAKSCRITQWF